jgi:decaprenylphospho-beta-D-ribofuranose 2-oxidase
MNILSWGNYPKIESQAFSFDKESALKHVLNDRDELISYGNGRSYGDSALSRNIIQVRPYNYFLHFDETTGLLHIQAGVLLSEILDVFVPRGWFLKITPGTKLITVGGAIASDVHGKNHHLEGCFSECVEMFRLMLPDGSIAECSRKENTELFQATCGGMGLTGVILDAKIFLKKIRSQYILQQTIKTKNLEETFAAFEDSRHIPYSVAWIDCLAKGSKTGRCLLMAGDFIDDGDLNYSPAKQMSIPFYFPGFVLNRASVRAFNVLYYEKVRERISEQQVGIDTFFYPLDAIGSWNRMYGKGGFTQYQFILPKETSFDGMNAVLQKIAASGRGSFLAVLKLYGPVNGNWLSFPLEGYSLALDFKIEKGLFAFLDTLDEIVVQHGGRVYLAKDVRVSREAVEQGYPKIDKFRALRKQYNMDEKFNSLQSRRLGL